MKRTTRRVVLALVLATAGNTVLAGEQGPKADPDESSVDVSAQATDPSAVLTQMAMFYWTNVNEDGDSDSDTFLVQPVLPLSKKNVLRPAIPFASTPGPDRVSGVGDLFLLDIQLFNTAHGTFGMGAVATLPTASDDKLGGGKYTLGPTLLYMHKAIPKNILGLLAYNDWSVAGDDERADVNKLTLQPIWVRNFSWGYVGWTDQTITIDWENDGRATIPVGLRLGKVFPGKTPWNMAVQPYYQFSDARNNSWGIKLMATAIFPKWLNH